jgi:hypothetical protein
MKILLCVAKVAIFFDIAKNNAMKLHFFVRLMHFSCRTTTKTKRLAKELLFAKRWSEQQKN